MSRFAIHAGLAFAAGIILTIPCCGCGLGCGFVALI
jgi:hypothetical protein